MTVLLTAACNGHGDGTPSVRAYVCETAYKPSNMLIACGDGNARVTRLHWSTWTATQAVGSGTWQQNDCEPYCAAGHFHDYPVRLVLAHPMPGQGTTIFGDATAVFPRSSPPGASNGKETLMRNGKYAS